MNNHFVCMLLLAGMGLLSGCGSRNDKYDATGTFEATEVVVSAEAQGKILSLPIQEGQQVEFDQVAGSIDSLQLILQKEQLMAGNRAINARSIDVGIQIASLQEQIRKQRREKERFEALLQNNAATVKQVDDIKAQLQVLEKQLAAQQTSLRQNNAGVKDESQSLAWQVAQVTDRIGKCRITVPTSGIVLTKYAEAGEFATPGKPLFKVADLERPFLRAYVTSEQLASIKLNQKVDVFADFGAGNIRSYPGVISWIGDKSEFTPKGIQTANERANLVYPVKIRVANDGYIKIGMYGGIRFKD